jgi:hypothetical protein
MKIETIVGWGKEFVDLVPVLATIVFLDLKAFWGRIYHYICVDKFL